jgi:regulator of protease activity HflC (stomatin/prohibitin superfamily)
MSEDVASSLDKIMYSFVMEDVIGGIFISVPPGYAACVYDRGKGVLKKILPPGLHFKIPFWQKAKLFNTQTIEYTINSKFDIDHVKAMGDLPIGAQTNDAKSIVIEGTILLRLDVNHLPNIWQNIGEDFVPKIIRPTMQSRMRLVASHYNFLEIVSTNRQQVESEMKDELEKIFYPRGIFVENVLLSEIGLVSNK